ncbi:Cytochrome c-type biogenesis protein CcmF [Rhodocyclaceae bacterium]|nr:Cytochrome c-type biogenesis protein CcmF [Rhodocyclaceae bacterium]
MIPEIGHLALILALALALVQGVLPIIGAARGNAALMALARPAARGQFVFVALAFACLAQAFLGNDFSVLYVAQHSNSQLPAHFRFAAIWGGHEGSLLLWTFILTIWTVAVTQFSKQLPEEMLARVVGVMGLVSVGFLLFMLFTSNPFDRLLPAALDGRDLTPMLQDPGLILHPPMLYMGYVGTSVAFAFAIAALLGGKLDAAWARWSRPWTTVAWIFLTLGIMLGSWWAYYELGWGGWWFWDPVENASFMPWLVTTALVHSLAVTEKRGAFKNWTVLLAIVAFSLSLLGTFLVRSGVLTSVHAFAVDPARGVFILAFLGIVVGGSLVLFAWRGPQVGLGGGFDIISRESMLLVNNVLLMVAAASVFLGTLYPLFMDALGFGKLSVGPPYFDAVFAPIMALAVFLMGAGPFARWKQSSATELLKKLWGWLLASVALAVIVIFAFKHWTAPIVGGVTLGFWALLSSLAYLVMRVREQNASGVWAKLRGTTRSTYGMLLAHFGIGIFILGVTLVKGYETTSEVVMRPEDMTTVGGYTFRFINAQEVTGPNYRGVRVAVEVTQNGTRVTTLYPEKRIYNVQTMNMTESAIDTGLFRDLYVALGEARSLDEWVVRIQHKPMVDWIWVGCLIMAFGGMLAVSDRRYRVPSRRRQPEAGALAMAAAKTS